MLKQHHEELRRTESVIQVVHSGECLETAAVTSELETMKNLSQELLTLLERLDPEKKSLPRHIAHQLTSGSQDESHLARIVERMNNTKTNIILHVRVAGFKLERDGQSTIAASTAKISQLGRTVRELLGDGPGLGTASLIKNQPLHGKDPISQFRRIFIQPNYVRIEDGTVEDGTVVLSGGLNQIDVSVPKGGTTRMITGNLTRVQALQINGPVGKDEWKTISHLVTRDNEAGPVSSQVNYPVSGTIFASLLLDHTIKYVLLFVLIYTVF